MKGKNLAQNTVLVLAVLGSLVLLNVIGLRAFKRLDLTRGSAYTLSKASADLVGSLTDEVTVTAYFTDDLPPPYSSNARYVRDLLEEYRAASKGKLAFEMFDPATRETEKDKEARKEVKRDVFGRTFREPTEQEKTLTEAGLQPVEIRVIADDQQQTKRAWMGLVIRSGEKRETIPVVQSVDGLEYQLTTLIKKMTRASTPVIGLLGLAKPERFEMMQQLLKQDFEVKPATVGADGRFDDGLAALFVVGPDAPVDERTQKAIDQFLMKGRSVAFLLDAVQVDLQSGAPTPVQHGLGPLLASYGVTVGDQLVADATSASVTVQRGGFPFPVQVPYPFVPRVAKLAGDSEVSRGLSMALFPFVTQVSATSGEGRTALVLAESSRRSWLEPTTADLSANRDWSQANITPSGPFPLMVQVTGALKSHYASEANASQAPGEAPLLAQSAGDARLVVLGTSATFQNDFLRGSQTDAVLLLNLADWMVLDPAMAAIRSRGMAMEPLKADISDTTRAVAKLGNALGLPLLLALFGVVLWRLREARRQKVTP